MLTKIRRRLQQEEGFTLIELLVVILIIGILAAVAIPTFLSQKNKANDSNAQSNLKNAQTITESFANGNGGNYPQSTMTLLNSTLLPGDTDATNLSTSGNPVFYVASGGATTDSYMLLSPGAANSGSVAWYEIDVTNGSTTYGAAAVPQTAAPSASTATDATAAAAAITATATAFPSVTP